MRRCSQTVRVGKSLVFACLASLFLTPLCAGGDEAMAPSGWTPEMMLQVKRVAHVRPSPDGKRVVYTVAEAIMTDDRSEFVSQIWLANADGSDAAQLTFAKKSSFNPVWSRDGKYLAYVSERSGKANLFRLRVAGGEAEQLTDVKSTVGAFAWSADGSQIAFVMTDPPSEDDEARSKAKDDWRWVDREPKMERLYVYSLPTPGEIEKAEPRLLTDGDFTIGGALRPGGGTFDWSPDGKSIVFAHRKTPRADDWPTSDVSIVEVATGSIRPLAVTGGAEFSPLYSPDGRSVALVVSDDPPRWAGSYTLQIVPAAGGQPRTLPETFDRQPTLIGWSGDGSRLYCSETRGTLNRLYAIGVESGKIDDLYAGRDLVRSFELNTTDTTFGFVRESPQQPPEACISPSERFSVSQVSRANSDVERPPLGKVEVVRWSAPDGEEIEGLLTYPVEYKDGTRVPLLLQIHGGPMGVFVQTYPGSASTYPNAAFASRGFAILQPNPRGSSGYGKKFRYANYQDWGGRDFQDLMSGVDHCIARGIADPDRLGVMGWSYGGYMTSWTITQTRRFKAASVGAAVTNLVSFTGTADIPGFLPDYFGTQPWDDLTLYRGRSAVFNAKGVTTPALIQHGEADVRVPVSQGYEFYNALKQQGAPVEMLVLPRQPHGPTEPRMILKLMQTNLDWFEKHLGKKEVAVDFRELKRVAEQELKQSRTPGAAIAVVQGERVVFAEGFGVANVETAQPVTPEMLFRLGSTTKMFTAAALVSLAEEGKVKLDRRIGDCLTGLHPSIAALTPHQLLTHTAGLTDESIMSGLHDESALAAGVRAMDERWLFTEPGRVHSYANPGYWIAGLVCEQLSGKPYAEVLQERLFRPLAMKRTTLRPLEAMTWPLALGHEVRGGSPAVIRPQADNAATWPAGQMYSNVGELARFAMSLMNEGKTEGRQVLSPTLIKQLTGTYAPRPGSSDHYGYGLVTGQYRGVRLVSHGGSRSGYGSTIRIAPDHKVAVIILANRSGSSLPRTAAKALELMLPLNPEGRVVDDPQPLSETEIAALVGLYSNQRQTLELLDRDGRLVLRREKSASTSPLAKLGEDRLVIRGSDNGDALAGTLFIVRGADGAPEYLCSGSRAFKRQPSAAAAEQRE